MLFWRTKNLKQSPPPAAAATEDSQAHGAIDANPPQKAAAETEPLAADIKPVQSDAEISAEAPVVEAKVVTLPAVRLADRLHNIGVTASRDEADGANDPKPGIVDNGSLGPVADLSHDHAALRAALHKAVNGSHVLVVGPAGSGRRATAVRIAEEAASCRDIPADWIYAPNSTAPDSLKAYPVPHGIGARLVRDVQDALAKSSAMLVRLTTGDSYQISVAVLEEERRQRNDGGFEQLRRRAEAQNIALVRTSEGFVLAPMHDGRVVRSDVFRALPDALQRDVEARISSFESELQSLLGAISGTDVAIEDRHLALRMQTAESAIKPSLAVARKLFDNNPSIANVFDAIESDWTRRAAEAVRRGRADAAFSEAGLQAVSAEAAGGAPVVVARAVSATDLLGEIGRNAAGLIAVRPGYLARANGGFLIVDAWRLAADPPAWMALSAALESGTLQPMPSPGLAVTAEPVPLNVTLVLIAERRSLARLKAIDPRTESYFSFSVAFQAPTQEALRAGAVL